MPYGVDPNDVMLMARTMWGENAHATPDEYSAIANVIRNRTLSGDPSFGGDTIPKVILAPNQFQAWNDPGKKNYPMKAPLRSPAFQSAYQVASLAMSGQDDDPTKGAVNYYNPDAPGQKTPAWAEGRKGTRIGQHVFYGPAPKPDVTPEDQATIGRFYPAKKPQDVAPSDASALTDEDQASIAKFYPAKTAGASPAAEAPNVRVAGEFDELPATAMEKPLNEVGPSSETLAKIAATLFGGGAALGTAKALPGLIRAGPTIAKNIAKAVGWGAAATVGGGLTNEVLGPEHGAKVMDLIRGIQHSIPEAP